MKIVQNIYTIALGLLLVVGCKSSPKLETSPVNLQFQPFFEQLGKADSASLIPIIHTEKAEYASFFKMYAEGMLQIRSQSVEEIAGGLQMLTSDPIYRETFDTVQQHFQNLVPLEETIKDGFGRAKTALPALPIPDIFWVVSGFNDPVAITDSTIAISLEHYLGANHVFYDRLGVYNYLRLRKEANRIPIDILEGWIKTEVPAPANQERLIDQIIYEGKVLCLLEACYPNTEAAEILGYSNQQFQWAETNEQGIWTAIVEWKHLYDNQPDVLRQYLGEAPFTKPFGNQSAPRLGRYMGYKIVKAYLRNNPDSGFVSLFQNENAQFILQASKYRP